MEILQAEINKRSRPVLVRLTPEVYEWLSKLSDKAGGGIATTIRSILEAARADGVSVTSRRRSA
jgi:predicted DNA-binding protein